MFARIAALVSVPLLAAVSVACMSATTAAAPDGLTCRLSLPASVVVGRPALLRMTLRNAGSQPMRVLTWGTPFEPGWFSPYVDVARDGVALSYRGAMVKRGDPSAADYLQLDAAQVRESAIDLASAFDLSKPGHYRLVAQVTLHDVITGADIAAPRSRDAHRPVSPDCNSVTFDVVR